LSEPIILITGAAGLFGGILRTYWGTRYRLRLADIRPVEDLALHEEFVQTDIVDYEQLLDACQGVHAVVHLAAYPGDGAAFYDTLLELNIIGAYNAFEAARAAGCSRIVFASSIDVVKGYWDEGEVGLDVPVYPTNLYGASKCWGEALGRVYAHQHGLSCICVRLCNPHFDQAGNWDAEEFISGISPRDVASLLALCVEAEGIDFAVVNGISDHRHGRLDLEETRRLLGFEPEDGSSFPRTGAEDH
jgi:NAD+ dependent glucose-6-phosphate dehydrogenase